MMLKIPLLLLGIVAVGCTNTETASQPDAAATVENWESLVKAVRDGRSDAIHVSELSINDNQLQSLVDIQGLRELILDTATVSDDGLAALSHLDDLEHLRLRGAAIGDAGLEWISRNCPSIRYLNLPQASFTDQGLKSLAALKHLELLRFGSPYVSDAGMAEIARLDRLRFLHLIDVPISGVGLRSLEKMQQLESLYLDGVQIPDEDWLRLFETLPQLHVHFDQQHHDRDPAAHAHD